MASTTMNAHNPQQQVRRISNCIRSGLGYQNKIKAQAKKEEFFMAGKFETQFKNW